MTDHSSAQAPENPPAFPSDPWDDNCHPTQGMTLRDWFAGQALIGVGMMPVPDGAGSSEQFARVCYGIADAMLRERSK